MNKGLNKDIIEGYTKLWHRTIYAGKWPVMKFKPIEPEGIKTYSLKGRKSKLRVDELCGLFSAGGSFRQFIDSLPPVLGAQALRDVIRAIVSAHRAQKTVAIGMVAHVIKTGLSHIIIELMRMGVIDAVAMNGACIVHDFELAFAGITSEDVDSALSTGSFGMAEETGSMLNEAINRGARRGLGIGQSVGKMVEGSGFPHKDKSILAAGIRYGVPVTVHVAIGTDILHIHPDMDGALTGKATLRDFRLFTGVVSTLDGGVFLNIGSAVIMPEVFLKALTVARNLGYKVKRFTTVNMDFIQHYRPLTNVVRRPTATGGRGYTLTGHHEILLPLLYAGIVEELGEYNR